MSLRSKDFLIIDIFVSFARVTHGEAGKDKKSWREKIYFRANDSLR